MENLRPKIKLKAMFKNKAIENAQSVRTPEPFTGAPVASTASLDNGDGLYPVISGGIKRKRAHKSAPRRVGYKHVYSPGMASAAEDEKFSGYDDNEDKVEDEEEVRTKDALMIGNKSASLKPEEARDAEPVKYRKASLRVKVKPSKLSDKSHVLLQDLEEGDNDKSHLISAFPALQNQNSAIGSLKECQNIASSRPEMHTTESGRPVEKPGHSQLKPTRSLDKPSTPRQVRSGRSSERSSSPHQSQAGESLSKSESQRTQTMGNLEGLLQEDRRQCLAAGKGKSCHSQYNEKELEAALMVVKKIMRMEAAEPFNVPVDPVSLGIPDYFDIIDTPMDLGTVCHTLERGKKYRNSKDVFQDVQLIWDNCCKYNHKGDPILDLMKRVKKNFVKYWTAAGLYYEPPKRAIGVQLSGKADAPTNHEDGRLKESEMEYQAGENSNGNLEDSQTGKTNKIKLHVQPGVKNLWTSRDNQNVSVEQTIAECKAREQNVDSDDFEAVEAQHVSEESEAKADTGRGCQVDAMAKNKGIKLVIKKLKSRHEQQDKSVMGIDETADRVSVGTDDESGPKPCDLQRSFPEETQQKDLGPKNRTLRRHGSHRHKPDCLCAVCVVTRRKHEREGKAKLAKNQNTRMKADISETLDEEGGEMLEKPPRDSLEMSGNVQPVEEEVEQEMGKAREQGELKGEVQKGERQDKEKETHVQHKEEAQQQEKEGQMQDEGFEKETSGKHDPADFELPLQSLSPSILKMCEALFTGNPYSAWNQAHSLTHRPSTAFSENPFIAAISTFMD